MRLVDVGREEWCASGNLFELPQMFLQHGAFSFYTHLVQVSSGLLQNIPVEEIAKHLPQNSELFLIPRGNPEIIDGVSSLPAEISWTEINDEVNDPFSEISVKEDYLSQCLFKKGILKSELYD